MYCIANCRNGVHGGFRIYDGKGLGIISIVAGTLMAEYALFLAMQAQEPLGFNVADMVIVFSVFYIVRDFSIMTETDFNGLGLVCLALGIYISLACYFYSAVGDLRFGIFAATWAVSFLVGLADMLFKKNLGMAFGILMAL